MAKLAVVEVLQKSEQKIMFVLLANYLVEYVIILQRHVLHAGLIKHYLYGITINAFQFLNVILDIFQTL